MSDSSTASTPSWVRVEYEGHNNTLAVAHLHVGQRVRVEVVEASESSTSSYACSTEESLSRTAKATVRYVGPVAAARDPTAVMVGVEWDEGSARGRNDGSVGGARYFQCKPRCGSFIHPARVMHAEPNSLLRAIESKYETRFKADANVVAGMYLVAECNRTAAVAAATPTTPPTAHAATPGDDAATAIATATATPAAAHTAGAPAATPGAAATPAATAASGAGSASASSFPPTVLTIASTSKAKAEPAYEDAAKMEQDLLQVQRYKISANKAIPV